MPFVPRLGRPSAVTVAFTFTVSFLLTSTAAWAQLPGLKKPTPAQTATPAPPSPPETMPAVPEAEAPDSPRASSRAFRELAMKKGDNVGAARYLVLPAGEEERGPELARRLRAVLERYVDVPLATLSGASEGNRQDGLPEGVDAMGSVPDGRGGEEPVFLVRLRDTSGQRWAFSRQTVSRVDAWYDALPDRWIRDAVPRPLQLYGPWGVMWWQWIALPALVALALAAGRVVGGVTTRLLHRLFRRTPTHWDERLLKQVAPALTLLWTVAAAALLLSWLGLRPRVDASLRSLLAAWRRSACSGCCGARSTSGAST